MSENELPPASSSAESIVRPTQYYIETHPDEYTPTPKKGWTLYRKIMVGLWVYFICNLLLILVAVNAGGGAGFLLMTIVPSAVSTLLVIIIMWIEHSMSQRRGSHINNISGAHISTSRGDDQHLQHRLTIGAILVAICAVIYLIAMIVSRANMFTNDSSHTIVTRYILEALPVLRVILGVAGIAGIIGAIMSIVKLHAYRKKTVVLSLLFLSPYWLVVLGLMIIGG